MSPDPAKQALSRRAFVGGSVGGFMGLWLACQSPALWAAPAPARRGRAKAVILLWLGGGPSQIDTFDPKPGLDTGGPFKAIRTAIPGIQLSEHLPKLAGQMREVALIRSLTSREGNHDRAHYLLHTGYVPQAAVQHPGLGAVAALELGKRDSELPSFVSINGGSVGPGYLGPAYRPFILNNPGREPAFLKPAYGVDKDRHEDRLKLLKETEAEYVKTQGGQDTQAHREVYGKAFNLMESPLTKVFNIEDDKGGGRMGYNLESSFGRGCLVARRLVEAGVPFVEVQLGGWDTHSDNFEKVRNLLGHLDANFAALVADLKARRLLESTVVICMGEFGRTPKINENAGRDHFPRAFSAALAGGGIRGGQVIGATDAKGMEVKDNPVQVKDLFATLATSLGLDPAKENVTPEGRPITLVDKQARVVEELFG